MLTASLSSPTKGSPRYSPQRLAPHDPLRLQDRGERFDGDRELLPARLPEGECLEGHAGSVEGADEGAPLVPRARQADPLVRDPSDEREEEDAHAEVEPEVERESEDVEEERREERRGSARRQDGAVTDQAEARADAPGDRDAAPRGGADRLLQLAEDSLL